MEIKTWLEETKSSLESISQEPGLDAQILLVNELRQTKTWILSHPEYDLDPNIVDSLKTQVNRARHGEPIPYLIGHWEFYALDFLLTKDVLIPRPETELIVDLGLRWLHEHPQAHHVIDIGTGSGCIVVSLAVHFPDLKAVATDISPKALKLGRKNAEKFHVENRVKFFQTDLFHDISGKFDLICANLPYIPSKEMSSIPVAKFEPREALDGGEDGLAIISSFFSQVGQYLSRPGLILCEFGVGEEVGIMDLAQKQFPHAVKEIHKDLHGISRLVSIEISK